MFRGLKASLKRRKAKKALERSLAGLETRFPQQDWKPFRDVTQFFQGKSMSSLEEQAFLYRLAAQLPPNATVIEIGSWIGHSTCIIGVSLRGENARLCAIDAFTGTTTIAGEVSYYKNFLKKVSATASQRELFDRHLAHFGLQNKVTAVAADSLKAVPLMPADLPPADFLFIDGGHALDIVRKDIENYVPLVKSGGIVVFHDFSSECGVPTAVWEEIKRGTFGDLIGIYATLLAFRKA
jgi:predicted O-methyltransferase YrrM